jgi:hypothetical protein
MDNKNGPPHFAVAGHFYFQVVWLLSAAPEAEGESALTPRLSFVMFHFRVGLGCAPVDIPASSSFGSASYES